MKEIVLPNDIQTVTNLVEDLMMIPYQTEDSSVKTRITLDYHLFCFLLNGEKTVSNVTGSISIDSTKILFIPCGNCLMTEKLAANGVYQSLLLFVSRDAFSSFFANRISGNLSAEMTEVSDLEPKSFERDKYLDYYIESLILAACEEKIKNNDYYGTKFNELMAYLLHVDGNLSFYFKNFCQEMPEETKIRVVVNTHMHRQITVDELAFLCNMSRSTFKRKFAKIFGDTPKQWLFKIRMQKAAELLKSKGLTASEIYEDLCYDNLSSFVQAFKNFHGVTPKKFQRV